MPCRRRVLHSSPSVQLQLAGAGALAGPGRLGEGWGVVGGKDPPAIQETQVRSLGWDDALEKEMATYFSILVSGFSGGSDAKESTCNMEDLGSIPGLGRIPGEGYG